MPALILAIVVGYLLAAPDRWTLRTTRGAAGAVRASIGSGRSSRTRSTPRSTRSSSRTRSDRPNPARSIPTRSTPRSGPRSTPRSGRSKSTPIDPIDPDPIESTRSTSSIARAIHGWIEASDRAVRRRGEAAAAVRRLRDRARDRRAVKQRAAAEDEAWDENERRDRAAQRARITEAVQPIAAQYDPPAPPARQDGGSMADFTRTITTELDNHQQFEAELQAAQTLAGEIEEAVRDLNTWRTNLPERYAGVADLYKTDGMNANVALMREEQGIGDTERQVRSLRSRLQLLHYAVDRARNGVKDSDASSGRVETAIGS